MAIIKFSVISKPSVSGTNIRTLGLRRFQYNLRKDLWFLPVGAYWITLEDVHNAIDAIHSLAHLVTTHNQGIVPRLGHSVL